jgi:hypothetical protein
LFPTMTTTWSWRRSRTPRRERFFHVIAAFGLHLPSFRHAHFFVSMCSLLLLL